MRVALPLLWLNNLRPCARRKRCKMCRRLCALQALGEGGKGCWLERLSAAPRGCLLRGCETGTGVEGEARPGSEFHSGHGSERGRSGEPGAGVPGAPLPPGSARVGGVLAELLRASAAGPFAREGLLDGGEFRILSCCRLGKGTQQAQQGRGWGGSDRSSCNVSPPGHKCPLQATCVPSRLQVSPPGYKCPFQATCVPDQCWGSVKSPAAAGG